MFARILKISSLHTALILLPLASFAGEITFYRDIAPITIRHCAPCHRKGEVAPFPLVTYEDVSSKAKLVHLVTETRYMPPWLADPSYRRFDNERLLTGEEISLIREWVISGKAEGDKRLMPPLPNYDENSLISRKPDMVLRMKEPFRIEGNNKETFAVIKFPGRLTGPANVEAIEFVPGNRELAHHMNFELFPMESSVDLEKGDFAVHLGDAFKLGEVYRQMWVVDPGGKTPQRIFYDGWVPGMSPRVFPDNFGLILPPRFILLVNSIHYASSPVDAEDDSRFNIYFKTEQVTRYVEMAAIGSGTAYDNIEPRLIIQPNTVSKYTMDYVVPADVSVMYISGHMHLLGKSFLAYAIKPGGKKEPLLYIPEWNIDWQEFYRFNPMLYLPKGTKLHVEGVYDNTANNPDNPFNPPQVIYSMGSMGVRREMMNLIFFLVQYQPGDETLILE